MKEKMTREMAARILYPDTSLEAQGEIDATMDDVNEACRMGAEALMPWVRTADRVPTEADADPCLDVFAWHIDDGVVVVGYDRVQDYPDLHPLWMSIPPLPEVEK